MNSEFHFYGFNMLVDLNEKSEDIFYRLILFQDLKKKLFGLRRILENIYFSYYNFISIIDIERIDDHMKFSFNESSFGYLLGEMQKEMNRHEKLLKLIILIHFLISYYRNELKQKFGKKF